MTYALSRRRCDRPEVPVGEIAIQAPPVLEVGDGAGGILANAIPMLGSLGSVTLMAALGGAAAGRGRSLLAAGTFALASVAFVLVQLDRHHRRRVGAVDRRRQHYLHHLASVRAAARDAATLQRAALLWQHPGPSALPAVAAEGSRVWENAPSDPRFLLVRYGVAPQPLSRTFAPADPEGAGRVDPVAAFARRRLVAVHRELPDLPAVFDVREFARIQVCGRPSAVRSLARAMTCSAAAFQGPYDLTIGVLATPASLAEWDWAKWLPHAWSTTASDAVGPRRLVATHPDDLAPLLPPGRHVLLLVDCLQTTPVLPALPGDGRLTVVELRRRAGQAPARSNELSLLVDEETCLALRGDQPPVRVTADQCDLVTAEALARRLAPRCADVSRAGSGGESLAEVLGEGSHGEHHPLRVPIGRDDTGAAVHLDLKESARGGMGPHGLVVGATGSGKSELLRTLVLGLALTHTPEQLNLVLVDFKGGATFAGLAPLPHVAAMVTNLEDELLHVDRLQEALSGELVRRQQLLRDAGHHASVHDYERARTVDASLPPLPSLLIVVDEFSELLTAKPEFLELLVAVGRLGRSLGLHLLLASQRLEEGRLRGLESHLSYRIGLRTFSAQESRAVLGVPDAFELPPTPGAGLLRADPSSLTRFDTYYVSGPAPATGRAAPEEAGSATWQLLPFAAGDVTPEPSSSPQTVRGRESLLDAAVRSVARTGPPAHQIWVSPLDAADTLDRLMPDLAVDPELGLVSRHWRSKPGGMTVPLGSVDRPREQRRDTLTVDLSGAAGHVAVVGGPRSGKSTLLRTLVTGLALTSTPLESQLYLLDFGGGSIAALDPLPHVAGTATRPEPDTVRRIVAEVAGILDRREAYFRAEGIDTIETYRGRRAEGLADDGYGDVFLVVDGWGGLRAGFEELEHDLQQLVGRGLSLGFHLLTSSARWADFRAGVRDLIGTRLELRLGDPLDSEVDRRLAALVPPGRPGRGIVPEGLHVQVALPRIDGHPDPATLGDAMAATVSRIADAWCGPRAPRLRLLPERLPIGELLDQVGDDDRRLMLGVDERDLAAVALDPDVEPHWLVFGESGAGKTAALRGYLHEVMRTRTPAQAQLVVVDYRRSLLGEVPAAYLLHHLTHASEAAATLAALADHLEARLPTSETTPEELRSRTWWTGAEVHVLVDDYDLVASGHSSPLLPLQPLLAQALDVGLRLVLARRTGGAQRALHEPVLQTLRELSSPGLVLSGSPEEGRLLGTVAPQPAPPGRGRLVTRDRGVEVVQLAWREPC